MFADIVGFTAYCEAHAAEDVVDNLDRLARDCEGLMSSHGLEKIKTIGDGFVITGNLLQPLDDPVMAEYFRRRAIGALMEYGMLNFSSHREEEWLVYTPVARALRQLGVPFEWLTENV